MAVRIRATAQESYAAYMRFLPNHPEEYDKLLETLCINVTEFFRDSEVWVTAKYLLENLISQKSKRTISLSGFGPRAVPAAKSLTR